MKSRILDPNFKYVSAAATDIQATWRKFGWRPLSAAATDIQATWRKFGWRPLSEVPNMRKMDRSKIDQEDGRVRSENQRVRQ